MLPFSKAYPFIPNETNDEEETVPPFNIFKTTVSHHHSISYFGMAQSQWANEKMSFSNFAYSFGYDYGYQRALSDICSVPKEVFSQITPIVRNTISNSVSLHGVFKYYKNSYNKVHVFELYGGPLLKRPYLFPSFVQQMYKKRNAMNIMNMRKFQIFHKLKRHID